MEVLKNIIKQSKLVIIPIEKAEAATVLDTFFGFDLRKTLEKHENELKGFTLKVIATEKQTSGRILEHSFDFKMKDYGQRLLSSENGLTTPEEIKKLLDRIELLQKLYGDVLRQATAKVADIQREFENKDYTITIVVGKNSSDTTLMSGPKRSCSQRVSFGNMKKRKISFNSNPESEEPKNSTEYPKYSDDSEMVTLGPHGTQVHKKDFQVKEWKDAQAATRALCTIIFGENILATHSLTGNQSPAFRGRERPDKGQLDPKKTSDITCVVTSLFTTSQQLVRATITTKCADACKKFKRFAAKKRSI